jgi:UDP-GlcNAc:undecaprenyl-phosphate GlcNAc-1-phosphate transferase
MIVGLVDDIRPIRGRWKLSITFALGAGASLVSSPTNLIGAALVGMWVVLLANAYNLSDNMNGLSASLAAIACLTLYTISGNGMRSVSPLGLGGALVGFLPHNARHARVFLGDSGSLALGTFIALTQSQLVLAESEPCSIWACALVAFVPLADTAFVIMTRPLRGRSPLKGGTDHLSHRLTYLGLSPAYAVLVLGIAQAVAALLALLVHRSPLASAGMLTTLAAMAAMLLGSLYERTESRVRSS